MALGGVGEVVNVTASRTVAGSYPSFGHPTYSSKGRKGSKISRKRSDLRFGVVALNGFGDKE